MKICIVTPDVVRGTGQGRANYEIVWEALRRGHDVTLLANRVAPELQQHGQVEWIAVPRLPTELLRSVGFLLWSTLWLRKHRAEFDLVQIHGASTLAPVDINTVQFVHSAWMRSPVNIFRVQRDLYGAYQWLYTTLNADWEIKNLRQSPVVVSVSERVSQELVEITGVPRERIRCIFNGVDLQEFSPGLADRNELGLPENVTLALFVGDIRINRKNLDTVLHALVQIPNLHLAVVGEIAGSPYPRMAASLSLSERVHFLGYRRDIPAIMQAADLFVFPSRYEPFGMVVVEAMATGLPVITAATTGAAEIVTPESGIVLSDCEDKDGLAQALNYLARDPALRKKMGQAGRAIAEEHSWVSKAQNYLDLFESLVDTKQYHAHTYAH